MTMKDDDNAVGKARAAALAARYGNDDIGEDRFDPQRYAELKAAYPELAAKWPVLLRLAMFSEGEDAQVTEMTDEYGRLKAIRVTMPYGVMRDNCGEPVPFITVSELDRHHGSGFLVHATLSFIGNNSPNLIGRLAREFEIFASALRDLDRSQMKQGIKR
jgi:hypothetical protein